MPMIDPAEVAEAVLDIVRDETIGRSKQSPSCYGQPPPRRPFPAVAIG